MTASLADSNHSLSPNCSLWLMLHLD